MPGRPVTEHPDQEHPEERLDVAALCFEQVSGGDERRHDEWRRRQGGQPGDSFASRINSHQRSKRGRDVQEIIVRRSANTVGPSSAKTGAITHASTPSMYSCP